METLPDEILCYIVQYIKLQQDAGRFSAVSKHIRALVTSTWGRTHEMRVQGLWELERMTTIWEMHRLKLVYFPNMKNPPNPNYIWPHVRELRLVNPHLADHVRKLLSKMPLLTTVAFVTDQTQTNPCISRLLMEEPRVVCPHFVRWEISGYRLLSESYGEVVGIPKLSAIQCMSFDLCVLWMDQIVTFMTRYKDTLRSIHITRSAVGGYGNFIGLSPKPAPCMQLTTLHMVHCDTMTDEFVEFIIGSCTSLESVDFSDCPKVGDATAVILASSFPRLHTMVFSEGNGRMGEAAVTAIVRNRVLRNLWIWIVSCNGNEIPQYYLDLIAWKQEHILTHKDAEIYTSITPCLKAACDDCALYQLQKYREVRKEMIARGLNPPR